MRVRRGSEGAAAESRRERQERMAPVRQVVLVSGGRQVQDYLSPGPQSAQEQGCDRSHQVEGGHVEAAHLGGGEPDTTGRLPTMATSPRPALKPVIRGTSSRPKQ